MTIVRVCSDPSRVPFRSSPREGFTAGEGAAATEDPGSARGTRAGTAVRSRIGSAPRPFWSRCRPTSPDPDHRFRGGGTLQLVYALGHSVLILIAGTSMGAASQLIENKKATRVLEILREAQARRPC